MTSEKIPGLGPDQSIGGNGRYSEFTTDCFHAFPFGVFRDHSLFTGATHQHLFTIDRPLEYQVRTTGHSWTGVTEEYALLSDAGTQPYLDVHLRSTLPAPLLVPRGPRSRMLRLHFPGTTCPRDNASLTSDLRWGPDETDCPGDDQAFLLRSRTTPFLLVASAPLRRVQTICHRHLELQFEEDSPRILLVPILDPSDEGSLRANLDRWLALVAAPPIEISESFEEDREAGTLRVEQRITGLDTEPPAFGVLPPFAALMAEVEPAETALVRPDPLVIHRLLTTNLGPYSVVEAPTDPEGAARIHGYTIETAWMNSSIVPRRTIEADSPLAPVPDELTYAGDWTWDPSCPMDQLLSLRTWGNLLQAIPEPRRTELLEILEVPEPGAFRKSLMAVTEPISGHTWMKDNYLFHQKGKHVAFDTDWYNGLCLSGLQRATSCGEPQIEADARALASDCRKEREALIAYFTIFHDWQISIASMETHFPFLNTDCAHNGLEGLLAEAKLRDAEGDPTGAAFVRYLAAKSAMAIVSAIYLPRWIDERNPDFIRQPQPGEGWTNSQPDPRLFGALTVGPHSGILPVTPATKNPYQFAGHFPEYTALIKAHGPLEQFREITQIWEAEFPKRYSDWITHYTGENWERRFTEQYDQEARIQAPVFYALAPEVCLRLWIFEEDPAEIEARFEPQPINLAEQVLLRASFELRT